MRKWIIIALFTLLPLTSVAQFGDGFGVGVRAGVNLSDFTGSTGGGRTGFIGGAFVDYNIKRFGFELGFSYAEQGSLGIVQSGAMGNSIDYRFDYLNMQLLAKYQVYNGFRIFLGPQFSYMVSAVEKRDGVDTPFGYASPWDIGIKAGVGFTFSFGLDLSASYTYGFFDMFQSSRTAYNSVFAISVGWRFSLSGKKK